MPFDDQTDSGGGGGGGDDPRHAGIDDIAEACVASVVFSAEVNDRCISCLVLATGIKLLGRWLANSAHIELQNNVDQDTATAVDAVYGTVEGEMKDIISAIMDTVKSDLADIEKMEREKRNNG